MARIGLKNFTWAPLTEGVKGYEDSTYGTIKKIKGAIECNVTPNLAEGKLYGDDRIMENISEIADGAITMGCTDDDDEIFGELLGQKSQAIEGESGTKEYISKSNDIPIAVGFGHVIPKTVNGVRKYKVEFLPKVTFKPFNSESKTKGESLEYTTPSVEGTIYSLADGMWKKHATFDTEQKANSYLESCFKQATGGENA